MMNEVDEMKWQEHEEKINDILPRLELVEIQMQQYNLKLGSVENKVDKIDVTQQGLINSVENYGEKNGVLLDKLLEHSLNIKAKQEETTSSLQLANAQSQEKITIAKLGRAEKVIASVLGAGGIAGLVVAIPAAIEAIGTLFK